MNSNRQSASQFVEGLLGQGRYAFESKEAKRRLGGSSLAVYKALHRLEKSAWLVSPKSGFYVIVDPQHRPAGTLPPEWFIHELMRFLKMPYYVGLLSAAQLYGATHHRPQEFQVVIPKRAIRPVKCGNIHIRFFGKGLFKKAGVSDVKTPAGMLKASSPETTAWDVMRYPQAAGGMDNVVTILSELAERLDGIRLSETVQKHGEALIAQRMGYILEKLGHTNLAGGLMKQIEKASIRLLDSAANRKKGMVDRKWRLMVNARVEPEA